MWSDRWQKPIKFLLFANQVNNKPTNTNNSNNSTVLIPNYKNENAKKIKNETPIDILRKHVVKPDNSLSSCAT